MEIKPSLTAALLHYACIFRSMCIVQTDNVSKPPKVELLFFYHRYSSAAVYASQDVSSQADSSDPAADNDQTPAPDTGPTISSSHSADAARHSCDNASNQHSGSGAGLSGSLTSG